MAILHNKLTPLLVSAATLIVVFVLCIKISSALDRPASGTPMRSASQPGVEPASARNSSDLVCVWPLQACR